ncbi:hypothetical protein SAMN05444267_100978 [Chryseobacterium polytrichastri]|uniref:Uncharacterized protein n=1 Tax=Chryseobacterium polytrichastri TaxID=1302687 RepID=A0A1M6WEX2_9FLAO|nr:hypothetical protein SAMN05444267_100978 [Chryseobacterium polytrichastri]
MISLYLSLLSINLIHDAMRHRLELFDKEHTKIKKTSDLAEVLLIFY